jgi:hypothetical protein
VVGAVAANADAQRAQDAALALVVRILFSRSHAGEPGAQRVDLRRVEGEVVQGVAARG